MHGMPKHWDPMPASALDNMQLVPLPLSHGPGACGDLEGWQVGRAGHEHFVARNLKNANVMLAVLISLLFAELQTMCLEMIPADGVHTVHSSVCLMQDPQRVSNLQRALRRGEPKHAAACRAAQRVQRAQRDAEVAAVLNFFQRSTALPQERVVGVSRVQNPRLWATFSAMRCAHADESAELGLPSRSNLRLLMPAPEMLARRLMHACRNVDGSMLLSWRCQD